MAIKPPETLAVKKPAVVVIEKFVRETSILLNKKTVFTRRVRIKVERFEFLRQTRKIFKLQKYVYEQVGPCMLESHYQTALELELRNMYHPLVISRENCVLPHYTSLSGHKLTLGNNVNERMDILLDDPHMDYGIIIELKAVVNVNAQHLFQVSRYLREMEIMHPHRNYKCLILNFSCGTQGWNCSTTAVRKDVLPSNMVIYEFRETWQNINKK